MIKKENKFQSELISELKQRFPGCLVLKNNPNYIQGIPDLTVLYEKKWGMLECKKDSGSSHRPNQDYYVEKANSMSFGRFVTPENKEDVLNEMEQAFRAWKWNKHSELEGKHAFLSPSQYHWLKYDEDKLKKVYMNHMAAIQGTQLHDFAKRCIQMGVRLRKTKNTLDMYVNDAIEHKMTPEVVLYYSENCYGTADAISFRNDTLRISDYKSGSCPAYMSQLMVYDAIFCLEYRIDPYVISHELRIYQNNDIVLYAPTGDDVQIVMNKIVESDRILEKMKGGLYED